MTHRKTFIVLLGSSLLGMAFRFICADPQPGEQTRQGPPHRHREPLSTNEVIGLVTTGAIGVYSGRWASARTYEKLMIAEALLYYLKDGTQKQLANYQWKPGANDLRRVAGRAKWGLDLVLGVELANVLPNSSAEDLDKLHIEACRVVDAYRNGIVALASDCPVPAERLADLKRRYKGKMVPDDPKKEDESIDAMDALLGEWPPIGRKLADLESIVGVKAKPAEHYKPGAVSYRFVGDLTGRYFFFIVEDGIIRSVHVTPH